MLTFQTLRAFTRKRRRHGNKAFDERTPASCSHCSSSGSQLGVRQGGVSAPSTGVTKLQDGSARRARPDRQLINSEDGTFTLSLAARQPQRSLRGAGNREQTGAKRPVGACEHRKPYLPHVATEPPGRSQFTLNFTGPTPADPYKVCTTVGANPMSGGPQDRTVFNPDLAGFSVSRKARPDHQWPGRVMAS